MVLDTDTGEVIDPAAYTEMFEGRRDVPRRFAGVCGRVVRGRAPIEFSKLSFARDRRLAWLTGPAGLRSLVGCTSAQVLERIGKSDQPWLNEQLAKGMRFRLIVMPQAVCRLADWDGVFDMVEARYPEIAPKIHRWRERVRDPSIVGEIGAELVSDAVKSDPDHPDHMSAERYSVCDDTAQNARLFLWHSLGMNERYVGDGYTSASSHDVRLDEYLTANVSLETIPAAVMIDLSVEPARLAP